MTDLEKRAEARRQKVTIQKIKLHSEEHHSFHIHLNTKQSWELLAKLSKEAWIEQTGNIPSNRVDKSIYRFVSLDKKYS